MWLQKNKCDKEENKHMKKYEILNEINMKKKDITPFLGKNRINEFHFLKFSMRSQVIWAA